QSGLVVGADDADELDPALLGPAVGEFVERARDPRLAGSGGLLGRQTASGAVAVMGVAEALERAGAFGQVLDAGEPLLAEDALLEGVVEVLDGAVAPRLAGRDEHRGGVLPKAHAHDLPQPGRGAE